MVSSGLSQSKDESELNSGRAWFESRPKSGRPSRGSSRFSQHLQAHAQIVH
jgi:hypothetical protein